MSGFGPPPGPPEAESRQRPPSYLPPGGLGAGTGAGGAALPGGQPAYGVSRLAGCAGIPAGRAAMPMAHRPGIIPLRPLGLGDILDGAVKSFRRNPRSTSGISALVNAIAILPAVLLVGLVASGTWLTSSGASAVIDSTAFSALLLAAGTLFATMVLIGLLSYAVAEAALGRKPDIAETWRAVRRRVPTLVALQLLIALALVLPLGLLVLVLVLLSNAPAAVVLVVALLLAAAAAVWSAWLGTRTLLAAPVLVLEKRGVFASLKRAWSLSRGAFWRLLGVALVAWFMAMVVFWVIQAPLMIAGTLILSLADPTPGPALFFGALNVNLATLLACTVVTPFVAAVTCLQYIDVRMRREGFDLVLIRAASGRSGVSGGAR